MKIDLNYNQCLLSVRKDGELICHIEAKDGKIVIDGKIGYFECDDFVEMIKKLQGYDITIDNFYW